MNTKTVFQTDNTGSPRRCANQTPSGSIEAATSEAKSVCRGVEGAVIAYTSTSTAIQERLNNRAAGGVAQLFSIAIRKALITMVARPTSVFVCGDCVL